VTAIFTPSVSASDQAIVHRPERTHLPIIPGTSKGKNNDDPEVIEAKKNVTTAVKVGIAIGVFVGVAVFATLVVMWVLHRRNISRYAKLGDLKSKSGMLAGHPNQHQEQHSMHLMPSMTPGHPSPYEPMRSH
jgi:hypothetical protein